MEDFHIVQKRGLTNFLVFNCVVEKFCEGVGKCFE